MSSPVARRCWRKRRAGAEAGVAILEYMLLVALVAVAAIGALVYFGGVSAGPVHQLNTIGSALGLGGYTSTPGGQVSQPTGRPGGGSSAWCRSGGGPPCILELQDNATLTINLAVRGGDGPDRYSLSYSPPQDRPGFLVLESLGQNGQDEKVQVGPASCPPGGGSGYPGIFTLVVADSASPPDTARMRFSVEVGGC